MLRVKDDWKETMNGRLERFIACYKQQLLQYIIQTLIDKKIK